MASVSCVSNQGTATHFATASKSAAEVLVGKCLTLSPDDACGFSWSFLSVLNDPEFIKMGDRKIREVCNFFVDKLLNPNEIRGSRFKRYTELPDLFVDDKPVDSAYDILIDAVDRFPQRTPQPLAVGRFCHYLANQLADQVKAGNLPIWVGFRILEKHLPFGHNEVEAVLKQFLKTLAEENLNSHIITRGGRSFVEIDDVDPRLWFGSEDYPYSSLWSDGARRGLTAIPRLVHKALGDRISSIQRASPPDYPLIVSLIGRVEAELPRDFTLPLVKQLVNNGFFVKTGRSISLEKLEAPLYARDPETLNDEQFTELLAPPTST